MKVIDVYKQYLAADMVYNEVPRKGAVVTLTATSDSGMITYEVGISFFPHRDAEDFAISYDAYGIKVLYSARGRRSKKREAQFLAELREQAGALAAEMGGTIDWDNPLRPAVYA